MKELKLHLPDDVHALVVAAAAEHGRSMNAELIERLRVAYAFGTLERFAERLLKSAPTRAGGGLSRPWFAAWEKRCSEMAKRYAFTYPEKARNG